MWAPKYQQLLRRKLIFRVSKVVSETQCVIDCYGLGAGKCSVVYVCFGGWWWECVCVYVCVCVSVCLCVCVC